MSGFAMGYQNYVTNPGGEWLSSSMPDQENAADPRRMVVTADNAVNLGYQWDAARPVQLIAVLNHNIQSADPEAPTFIVRLKDGSTTVWESQDVAEWSPPNPFFMRDWIIYLPSPVIADTLEVLGTEAVPGSADMFVGHIWAGPLWQPSSGISRRWIQSVIDPGEMSISRGGQGYPRRRQRRRRLDIELGHMPYVEAFGDEAGEVLDLQQIGFRVGITEPVIVLPRTRDTAGTIDSHAIHRLGVYGHLTDPLRIRHVDSDRFDAEFRVDELL